MGAADYILAANGRPFSDPDAAQIKAKTLTDELGDRYSVVTHPHGGYAICRDAKDLQKGKPEAAPEAVKTPVSQQSRPVRTSEPPLSATKSIDDENPWRAPETTARDTTPSTVLPAAMAFHAPEKSAELGAKHQNNETALRTISLRPAWRYYWNLQMYIGIGLIVAMFPSGVLLNILRINPLYVGNIENHGMTPLLSFLGLAGALMALGQMLYGRYANAFSVKPELVESCIGIVSRKTVRVEYTHIRSVDVTQGVIERILNVGKVDVASAASTADGAEVAFKGVANPMDLQEEIYRRRRLQRKNSESNEDD